MNGFARPPLSPLRRARRVALVVVLFVAFPFSALPLVGAATVERTSSDDAPDAESDAVDEARPARAVRAVSLPMARARLRLTVTAPVGRSAPPLPRSAATRELHPLRC